MGHPASPAPAAIRPALRGLLILLGLLLAAAPALAGSPRLEQIRARGHLTCGVKAAFAGFTTVDAAGRYAGIEADFCRVIAAAIFGDPARVEFLPAPSVRNFLAENRIDVVSRRLTWELTREAGRGMLFGPIMYYDAQGFLVRRTDGIRSAADLAGKKVCVPQEFAFEATVTAHFAERGWALGKLLSPTLAEAEAAFLAGRCAALTADISELGTTRLKAADPAALDILPDEISKEPLALMLRDDDPEFFKLVRWTLLATVEAEELGIASATVEGALADRRERVARLLGTRPGNGAALGLSERWAYDIIRTVGNYGEIFERNLGGGSPVGLRRGANRLWTEGGLMYAPPFR